MEVPSQKEKWMRAISLLYHDVVKPGEAETSGFPGIKAARYKLDCEEFERHLTALSKVLKSQPVTVEDDPRSDGREGPFMLTFDDGGISAYSCVVDLLDRYRWRGHFFVATNFIDRPTFVSKDHIRALRKKGHVIGSHSSSHPERMSSLNWDDLVEEWNTSLKTLSDVLGERVCIASVPGGYYSRKVAEAAAYCGIKVLFTSEPMARAHTVNGCTVFGRYTIWRGMDPAVSAGIASGFGLPRYKQFLFWNFKKVLKAVGGRFYTQARTYLLERLNR
jgi:peptidoglycan/xylan/chitin deacetylase (PgdA/CDA1 family)